MINARNRLNYVPDTWKTAKVIMILKPEKNLSEVESYRLISLLPIISKLFEKLILKRLKPTLDQRNLIRSHQFDFRNNHSTIDQIHCITDVIEKALKNKNACSAVSLAQAFDTTLHEDLLQ